MTTKELATPVDPSPATFKRLHIETTKTETGICHRIMPLDLCINVDADSRARGFSDDQLLAYAGLLAAGPELLAECEKAVERHDAALRLAFRSGASEGVRKAIAAEAAGVRSAVAKARGKSLIP